MLHFRYINNVLAIILLFVLAFASCKQKQNNTIESIKKTRADVDKNLSSYKFVKVDDIVSKGIGVIEGYFRDEEAKEAKKIKTQLFSDKSRAFTEYYFDDGMLIYAEVQEFVYNKPNTYTEEVAKAAGDSVWYDDSKTVLEINKFYFSDNKLFKWTGATEADTPKNIANFTQKEPEILAQAIVALKQLKEANQ